MSDKINQIKFELRSMLSEEIQEQAIITIEVRPGRQPEWDSIIMVNGFDRAMSRGTTGFGGGGTEGRETEEDVGAWKVLGLPERTATGMNAPSPWIVFMDWFWDFLKSVNLKPAPATGFGEVTKPYSHLTPAQKRQRKYGVQYKASEDPEGFGMPGRGDIEKTRPLRGAEHLWPAGFHIKRYVTIAISPLGDEQDVVTDKFRDIISKAKTPDWFRIAENREWNAYFVFVNVDAEMPEGWRDRLAASELYHAKRKAEWADILRDFSENRANVAQLRPILARYMVDRQKFEAPFNVEVLDDEQYTRAKQVVQNLKLEELIEYAKSIGVVPPVVGQMARSTTKKGVQLDKMWDETIERLAGWGAVDPLMVDVALSNWMVAHGFSDPFEFELLPPEKKIKALHMASRLTFADISEMMESVKAQIKSLLG